MEVYSATSSVRDLLSINDDHDDDDDDDDDDVCDDHVHETAALQLFQLQQWLLRQGHDSDSLSNLKLIKF